MYKSHTYPLDHRMRNDSYVYSQGEIPQQSYSLIKSDIIEFLSYHKENILTGILVLFILYLLALVYVFKIENTFISNDVIKLFILVTFIAIVVLQYQATQKKHLSTYIILTILKICVSVRSGPILWDSSITKISKCSTVNYFISIVC